MSKECRGRRSWRTRLALAALFVASAATTALPAGADTWHQDLNGYLTFYAPGPPPGPAWSGCIVRTGIWAENSPVRYRSAEIWTYITPGLSSCAIASVELVYFRTSDGTVHNAPADADWSVPGSHPNPASYSVSVTHGADHEMLGANFMACSSFNWICPQWQTTPF